MHLAQERVVEKDAVGIHKTVVHSNFLRRKRSYNGALLINDVHKNLHCAFSKIRVH